jgi:hypothetical protein
MATPIILYDNRFNDGTPVPTDTETGYDVNNIKDLRAYTFWLADSNGNKTIYVNCGSAKSADAMGIIGHNLFTCGATISVESSPDGAAWTTRLAGFTVTDNKAILKTFTTASLQWWRISLTGCSVAPYMAVCMIGVRLTFPVEPEAGFDPYGEGIEADTGVSVAGNLLGSTILYHPVEIAPNFTVVTRTWVSGDYKTFWDAHGKLLKPFFWGWDLTTYPAHVLYLRCKAGMKYKMPVSMLTYVDSLALQMEGVAE